VADTVEIVFQPSGRRGRTLAGTTLLAAAQELGVGIEAVCGGKGVCGKCRVIVEEGRFEKLGIVSSRGHVSALSPVEEKFFSREELERGYRLACLAQVNADLVVTVPEESRTAKQVILEQGKTRAYSLNPAVKQYSLTIEPAALDDARDDRQRLLDALAQSYGLEHLTVDYTVLRDLPQVLRQQDWQVTATVWQGQEVIRVVPGREAAPSLGIAIDIGTTTLAAFLCDLTTGELLGRASRMNPEIGYGEDVLARISYAMSNEDGREKLQQVMLTAISELAAEMTAKIGRKALEVDEMVLVYNTAMHHFTLGLEPKFMGRSPFVPAVSEPLDIKARDLGIAINPAANIHSLSVEAGFVGPDNVAVLLAEEPYKSDKVKLIIDIGTNGEIDLGNKDRLLSTSCATGPALEGAQIAFGMRAAAGAIERVEIDAETKEPRYKVIGQETWYPELKFTGAQGICGSGIIDVVAALYTADIISKAGRINGRLETPRVRKDENGRLEYVLAWAEETAIHKDITIKQGDIRAVQLAKGAIYTGAKYLMEKYGIEQVEEVILAGAFGSYINKQSALTLGLFPDCDLDNVKAVGNAAGDGARIALLDIDKRREAASVARQVEFVETAVEPDFQTRFMEALAIPHAKDSFPHLT